MAENINVFDFNLTEEEMQKIATLDTGHTEIIDQYDWHITEMLHTIKGTDEYFQQK